MDRYGLQLPFTQIWFAAHIVPQAPQLLVSIFVFTQAPPQRVSVIWQAHMPAVQREPPPQTIPQPPQFVGLVCVSTHWPLHAVPPFGQVQMPA